MDTTLADTLVGRVLDGRYQIQERIARGGMATVYRALDLRLDREVAVKVMHSSLAEDPEFVSRFTREAKSAARLSHPNVVAVFDQGSDGGVVFLVMEYVAGVTLRDVIKEHGRLSPRQALDVLAPVLSALDAAHTAGIVHRDIKPENVLIARDGRIKVADFGLARAIADSGHTATTGLLIGTAAYLAPEQIELGVADPRTDLYAAGVVLYELLTGRPPYEGPTPMAVVFKHVHETVPAPSLVRPEIPRSVDALVLDATQREPAERPPSAAELLEQLQAAARSLPPEPLDLTQPTQVLGTHLTTVLRTETTVLGTGTSVLPSATSPGHTLVAPPEWPPAPPTTPVRRRRGWFRGWRLAVLLLVLVTLAAAIGGAYIGIHESGSSSHVGSPKTTAAATQTSAAAPTTTVMPDFSGTTQSDAESLADDREIAVAYDPPAYSPTVPTGTVISQRPTTDIGNVVPLHTTVWLTLSQGPQPVDIPTTLVGMTLDAAKTALQAIGLDLGQHPSAYSETVPKGAIISVTTQGAQPAGTSIDVVVSKGPTPVAVPDESGKSSADAQADLKAKTFTNVSTIDAFSDSVDKGDVISQTPKLPATAQPTAAITLVISKGPELFAIPPLKGLSASGAEARLVDLGMKYHTIRLPNGPGNVLYTTPNSGQLEPRGTVVTLEIF